MTEIINGKKYNTETAIAIGNRSEGDGRRDHRAIEETLYRKSTGEFFLHGWGGPRTEYAETMDGGMRSDGERIRPMSDYDAYQWVKKYLDGDECAKLFGDKIPEKTKIIIVKSECNQEWDIRCIELSDGSIWFENNDTFYDSFKPNHGIYRKLEHWINISSVTWDYDDECWVFTNGRAIPWSDYDDEFPELDED